MTIRILALVTLVMVMSSATGCGGMRNFLFGRGARCGLCPSGPAAGPVNPYAPAQPAAPGCGLIPKGGLLPKCNLFGRNAAPTAQAPCANPNAYAPNPYAPNRHAPAQPCYDGCQEGYVGSGYAGCECNDGGYSSAMGGDCGCGSPHGGVHYEGGVVDPYLGSGVMGGGMTQGGMNQGGMIQGDGFQPRTYQSNKVDSRGDQIISQDPLPPGARFVD